MANASSTRGDVTVLGIRSDAQACVTGDPGAAQVLRRDGNRWVAEQRLPHPDPLNWEPSRPRFSCGGEFGESVSTDGTRIAVAARYRSGDTPDTRGVVYVYDRDGGTWRVTGTVVAPTGTQAVAVSVSGSRLAMVAESLSDRRQRLYLYRHAEEGWLPDGQLDGGAPLALDGDTLVYTFIECCQAGTQLLAERDADVWTVRHQIALNGVYAARSGGPSQVDSRLGNLTVIVDAGSLTISTRAQRSSGAVDLVELYRRTADGWQWEAELVDPASPGSLTAFGRSVSRDGDRLLVGADAVIGGAQPPGAAYLFTRGNDGTWHRERSLAPGLPEEQGFGYAVALSGPAAGVLAREYNSAWGAWISHDTGTGDRSGVINEPAAGTSQMLGWQADVQGDLAAALTHETTVAGTALAYSAGALHLYRRGDAGWEPEARVPSPGTAQGMQSGLTPFLRGPVVVHAGKAYVLGQVSTGGSLSDVVLEFGGTPQGWRLLAQIPSPNANTPLITSFAVAGDQLVMATGNSALGRDVYSLKPSEAGWGQDQFISAPGSARGYVSMNRSGTLLAVGNQQSRTAHVYQRVGNAWNLKSAVTLPEAPYLPRMRFDEQGDLAVAESYGSTLHVFSPQGDGYAYDGSYRPEATTNTFGVGLVDVGSAFLVSSAGPDGLNRVDVVERGTSGWHRTERLYSPRGQAFDYFGDLMAADGDTLLISAYGVRSPAGPNAGEVHLYRISDAVPPTMAVQGVTDGGSYDYGDVPQARCMVTNADTEVPPFPATLTGPVGERSASGLGTVTASCTYTSASGATATARATYTVVDTSPPVLHLPDDLVVPATGAAGAQVSYPTVTATDLVDGELVAACRPASSQAFPLGTTTVTCRASDLAGNEATGTFRVSVRFEWSGLRPPVTEGGSYRLGRTIPVKFALTGASAHITDVDARLWLRNLTAPGPGVEIPAASASAATSGNAFRYGGGQYVFQLDTQGLSAGTWQLRADLGDGVSRTTTIILTT